MERVKIKTTSWWPLAFGYLAMLTGFGLTALHDYKGLRASEHKTPALLASTTDATTVSDFEIKEWPRRLRTDLKGTSIKVALPENAPDRPWNDALMAKFRELTGIEVETIRPGNDTSAVLLSYLREFATGSPRADVYAIDIVWPGMLTDYAEDLRPVFGDIRNMVPGLVQNDTVHAKLVAVPYFVEISLLYYRLDLLKKYHFSQPPRTWNELEHQAKVIANGERANGKSAFWGFLWQGAASEALTCNALEWQISQGGGLLLRPDGSISLERARMVQALDRARQCCCRGTRPLGHRQLSTLPARFGGRSLRLSFPGRGRHFLAGNSATGDSRRPFAGCFFYVLGHPETFAVFVFLIRRGKPANRHECGSRGAFRLRRHAHGHGLV